LDKDALVLVEGNHPGVRQLFQSVLGKGAKSGMGIGRVVESLNQ
jgi:hypothetical protein